MLRKIHHQVQDQRKIHQIHHLNETKSFWVFDFAQTKEEETNNTRNTLLQDKTLAFCS